jgi:hypothetical protein
MAQIGSVPYEKKYRGSPRGGGENLIAMDGIGWMQVDIYLGNLMIMLITFCTTPFAYF